MASKPKTEIILATKNRHKVLEIKKMLRQTGIAVKSLADLPPMPDVVENGRTLEANALKKADAVMRRFGLPALSDDSGLFVPSLNGKPGVKSARYAGPACDYKANNVKLLKALKNKHGRERRAYFATVMALAVPGRKPKTRIGKIWGTITPEPSGTEGFGYDPIFMPQGVKVTFAQMPARQKNAMSHRALALQKMVDVIISQWG